MSVMKIFFTLCLLLIGCAQTKSKKDCKTPIPFNLARSYCEIRDECRKLSDTVGLVDELSECHGRQQNKARDIRDQGYCESAPLNC